MKKRILIAIIAILCIVFAIFYTVNHKSKNSNTVQNNGNKPKVEFKVLSAFADVDFDMIIQDKDTKDDDTSGDYILIRFTNEMEDTKKDSDSNPISTKSYTLDNKKLPDGSKIYIKDKYQIVIKLKNGYLKGINSPHSLIVSKNLMDKTGDKIKGSLNLKLPYSNSLSGISNGNAEKGTNMPSKDNSNSNSDNNPANNTNDKKSSTDSGENKGSSGNTSNKSNLPKYTVELGKGLPYATVVMVKLDTPNPEDYKISIEGNQLELKTNSEGKRIFIKGIKKVYELDQVQKLIKIEKIK